MLQYYVLLGSLVNLVGGPLRELDARIGIPVVTALILGLIGATSPCQLTTNVAALAYVSRDAASPRRVIGAAFGYLLGKASVYTVLGLMIALLGLEMSRTAVPVAMIVRKAMGPLLILAGLFMLGVVRLSPSMGQGLSSRLETEARRHGNLGPFLLGMSFAFAFCPTLFWLFFGLLVPMSLTSPAGLLYPGLFALGTTLPLLFLSFLFALGVHNFRQWVHQMKRLDPYARRAVAIVFLLVGINEVILYWLL